MSNGEDSKRHAGDTGRKLGADSITELANKYTVAAIRDTFLDMVDKNRTLLIDLLKDAYPHVKPAELPAILERDHQVYGPKLLSIVKDAQAQCDPLEIAFKVNNERSAQLEIMVQEANTREASYKRRLTAAERQKKKLEEDGTKRKELHDAELEELKKMGAQLQANAPASYEEIEKMKQELTALQAGKPGYAQQQELEARAQELDEREAKTLEDLAAVRKFSASLDENMRTYAERQKQMDADRTAFDARRKDIEDRERKYAALRTQLDLDMEYIRKETEKIDQRLKGIPPSGKRDEQLHVGMQQLREGMQRAKQYVVDIRRYLHDKREEVRKDEAAVQEYRKAAHKLLADMVTEGKKIVDSYLGFAVERATNQNKELGDALKTELENARATASGDVDKYFSGIQLSQVADMHPPEETKRYAELERGLDDIEKFLLDAEGSDILDLELRHDKPAEPVVPVTTPEKKPGVNDTVIFKPIDEAGVPPSGQ